MGLGAGPGTHLMPGIDFATVFWRGRGDLGLGLSIIHIMRCCLLNDINGLDVLHLRACMVRARGRGLAGPGWFQFAACAKYSDAMQCEGYSHQLRAKKNPRLLTEG